MSTRVKLLILLLLVAAIVLGAIVNRDEGSESAPTTPGPAGEEFADACGKDELELVEPGVMTIGAAGPSQLPWLAAGDPAPDGFEPGIALAVAEFMHFAPAELRWVDVAREDVLASGPDGVDFALGQILPTTELDETMDFTEWYYDVEQAVLVPSSSELAAGVTLADLREARLGAPAGPSHDAVLAAIDPPGETAVYESPAEALEALRDGEVDAVVIDYPTSLELLRGGDDRGGRGRPVARPGRPRLRLRRGRGEPAQGLSLRRHRERPPAGLRPRARADLDRAERPTARRRVTNSNRNEALCRRVIPIRVLRLARPRHSFSLT